MELLSQYMMLALSLSALLGLIGALAHPSLSREAEMGIGALCLAALASPILSALPSLSDIPLSGGEIPVLSGGISEVGEEAFGEGVRAYLCSELSLAEGEVGVGVSGLDVASMRASEITVTLSGRAALADGKRIRSMLDSLLSEGGKCKVVIKLE